MGSGVLRGDSGERPDKNRGPINELGMGEELMINGVIKVSIKLKP